MSFKAQMKKQQILIELPQRANGILLDESQSDTQMAKVVAVGADIDDIKVGDNIVFSSSNKIRVLIEDTEYMITTYGSVFFWFKGEEVNND